MVCHPETNEHQNARRHTDDILVLNTHIFGFWLKSSAYRCKKVNCKKSKGVGHRQSEPRNNSMNRATEKSLATSYGWLYQGAYLCFIKSEKNNIFNSNEDFGTVPRLLDRALLLTCFEDWTLFYESKLSESERYRYNFTCS